MRRGPTARGDLDAFVAGRRARWDELEELLDRAEDAPLRDLGREGVLRLVARYRQAAADLNRARALTANPELLGRLNGLTGRAYRFVYRDPGRRRGLLGAALRFALDEVPAAFQQHARAVLAAAVALAAGALLGLVAVLVDPAAARTLVPQEFFTESPRERVARIERDPERVASVGQAATFASYLYARNIQVGFLAFALGALTVVGGHALLFYNGAVLGAVAARYYQDGVTLFFLAWVGPHGALELPAICFAAGTGLAAGRVFLAPGDRPRAGAMRAAFPALWRMMAGAIGTFVLAGFLEGSFSQLSAKTAPYPFKIGVAVVLFVGLHTFLFWPRRRPAPDEARP